jgi:hypothetical protein
MRRSRQDLHRRILLTSDTKRLFHIRQAGDADMKLPACSTRAALGWLDARRRRESPRNPRRRPRTVSAFISTTVGQISFSRSRRATARPTGPYPTTNEGGDQASGQGRDQVELVHALPGTRTVAAHGVPFNVGSRIRHRLHLAAREQRRLIVVMR